MAEASPTSSEERQGLISGHASGTTDQHEIRQRAAAATSVLNALRNLRGWLQPGSEGDENHPVLPQQLIDLEAGEGGDEDGDGEEGILAHEERLDVDMPVVVSWLEQTLPFLVLLIVVFCSHHFIGIAMFIWLTSVLHRCNAILKQQAALWEGRSTRKVLDASTSLLLNLVVVYVVFHESHLWHRLLFLPPTIAPEKFTVWVALWAVTTNDVLIRFMAMLAKCALLLCGATRATQPSRRRQFFTLIESTTSVYRILTPVPVWYSFFVTVSGRGTILASMLAGLYLAMKLASITERFKFCTFVVGAFWRGDALYGKYATPEDIASGSSDGAECSICQGAPTCHHPAVQSLILRGMRLRMARERTDMPAMSCTSHPRSLSRPRGWFHFTATASLLAGSARAAGVR